MKHENPELEQRKKQLLEQEEHLKLQLTQLEEKLLLILGNSQGNILENQVSFIPSSFVDGSITNSPMNLFIVEVDNNHMEQVEYPGNIGLFIID